MSATIATLSSAQSVARPLSQVRFALLGPGTVVAAVVANALCYFVGSALVGYDPRLLPLGNVSGAVIFTVFPAIVAVLLYAALRRFTRQPARIFTFISAIVFVVTLIPDFTYIPTVPGSTNEQTAILVLMHAIAAAVIVRMLTLAQPARAR